MDVDLPIDPSLAPLFEPAVSRFPAPVTTRDEVLERRSEALGNAEGALGERVVRTDVVVPAESPVRVRLHRPVGVEAPMPCVLSLHGGGHLLGSYDVDDLRHDRWCPKLGYLGVAVDYRLALEHPYPAALDDCYATLAWVHEHAAELGVDPSRIGVTGTSSGGGLAAGL